MARRVSPRFISPKSLTDRRTLIALAALSTTAMLLFLLGPGDRQRLPSTTSYVTTAQRENRHFRSPPPPDAPPVPDELPPEPADSRHSRSPPPPDVTPVPDELPPKPEVPAADRRHIITAAVAHPSERVASVSLQGGDALAYVKMEIENVQPMARDDPDLYPPLFRNVSVFRRSYELMEEMLKVYIYREGSRPIFHTPPIKGIYASEGWFMKLLEKNKQFVTKDAKKAHLFYLPYSVHQLELALYKPESPNIHQLSIIIRDYVNMIAAKYPFWNRTHGSDHFIVACHDWGPYTTKEHDELLRNSIKALCNADASEGIFVHGRDVSLPETSIRIPRRPLRDMGGIPISQRTILAFYAGYMHGRVRPLLLKYWKEDKDMKIYSPLPSSVAKKMSYAQHMKSSKFCICPMGYEVNSPRIVEAIYYECVPVIIADNFVLPFDQVLNWSTFSVIVAEKDIPNLKDILLNVSLSQYSLMHTNVVKLQKHFLWHAKPVKYDLFHMILHSIWFSRVNSVELLEDPK